jgi:hypothetical protein
MPDQAVLQGVWKRNPRSSTEVLRSQTPLRLNEIISSISCSNISRKKDGVVSLFMCHVSPSCKSAELKAQKDATRIDIKVHSGDIRIWRLTYNPRKPDVVIKNGCDGSPA